MTKLDEKQIIILFQRAFGRKTPTMEDVETIKVGKNIAVIKIDTLVSGTDVPPGMSLHDVARKSIVACVSDFAAKGVRPTHCIVSVSLPKSLSRKDVAKLADGFKAASKEFNVSIIGGDTNESDEIIITVSMFGMAERIVRRKGAKSGDVIFVTGHFGKTASGLKILLERRKAKPIFATDVKKAVYHAIPRLKFGMLAAKHMTSSMDSSDGLSTTLVELSRQSRKKFIITEIPTTSEIAEFARANNLDLLDLVFNGGEEYEIVATAPQKSVAKLRQIAEKSKTPFIQIGMVKNGRGVFLKESNMELKDLGWSHFA
ncbi:MAG: thiamine-phosphate kinase [Candidatus Nitrosotenuis sp.]